MTPQLDKPTLHILIVDDVPQVRKDLRTVLPMIAVESGINLEVIGEAADGQEAIHQTLTLKPDVVLMDLVMPVLNGYAATQEIKAHSAQTRVVILTVHDDDESREKARLASADDFVEKGASLERLFRAIAPAIDRNQ